MTPLPSFSKMWSLATRQTALAIACATLLTYGAVHVANRLVAWRVAQHWRDVGERRKQHKLRIPRATRQAFQANVSPPWVALCGTVFDVADDAFFSAHSGGIYASWVGHDVAALLVYGGVIDGRPENETEAELVDLEIALHDVKSATSDLAKRRRLILEEWYARFYSRYEVVGQMSDLYAGDDWEALRDEMTPPEGNADGPRRRGKCPLGFGSSAVEEETVEIRDDDGSLLREVRFQGRRYDVRGSALFDGALAHFVGHDITYALATQSTNPQMLDVEPLREYSYEEQLRLEQYRRLFAQELRVIADPDTQAAHGGVVAVDLHELLDQDADFDEIQRAIQAPGSDSLNAECPRTTMTPLHKAVEKNRLDLVELLVQAGADINAPAALYDDDTALQMAQRFHYDDIAASLTAHMEQ